ncbi:stage III sporulation protein AF [Sporolactobacillus sp. CPB3-1]|uniref:Stage III sporulation protein AF n=1 Tax=Sporolactobacillus mangiferae TaxID=2940498 RepID=A0ABT0MCG9_9BACL|nr:stage III sporulation protein AF [Sporolactobacillus mangiferae]MCL1632564.1 stage III sporulation protein AF [Sporolactobacillus mangiferae]
MNYLVHWVSEVVLIVLFAVILELLIPAGAFQKYIKFVIGLVLIVALLDPVIRLFHVDPNSLLGDLNTERYNGSVKNETYRQKSEIQKDQAAYIQEQVVVQMKNQVKEELNEKYGLQITHLALTAKKNTGQEFSLDKVTVTVGKADTDSGGQESGSQTIQPVKSVSINIGKARHVPESKKYEYKKLSGVRSFLGKRWALDPGLIKINTEGGG